jgi:RimJ/RimL family protein N-acetyltransferase
MARITLEPVDENTPPETLVEIFNSNREFLIASGEKYPRTAVDVAMYFYEETSRENGRCLLIRLVETGEVVGTVGMAVPYVKAGCPWIGLLLIGGKWQGQGIGAEAETLLAETLAAEGWKEIQLGVLQANPDAHRFWERQGYRVTGERTDQDKRPVWVMSKSLVVAGS